MLGQHREKEADKIASSGFVAAIVLGMGIAYYGITRNDELMKQIGATDTILPYAKGYAQYILYAAPVMAASFVLNNLLRAEGKAKLAMTGIATGGILNIILDPVFIFGFQLGISGAAIATAISQCVSFLILLSHFMRKKTILKLHPKSISVNPYTYYIIIRNGLPSFCRQGLASIATVSLNINAALYGDAAVAAMSIVGKIFMMIFSCVIGFGQGYQPVVGYNYGAGIKQRVKEAFVFSLKVATTIMTTLGIVVYILAPFIVELFINYDTEVIRIGTKALRYQCLTMPVMSLGVISNMTFQSIGKAWTATFLSALRQGIYYLPFIYILPEYLGLLGVQITQPVADVCTFITCIPFVIYFFKKLSKE